MRTSRRLTAYLRPYAGRIVLAVVLVGLAGGLAAIAVSAVKPLVNNVLQMAPVGGDEEGFNVLDWLVQRVPEGLASWLTDKPYVAVPAMIGVAFLIRALFLFIGNYLLAASGAALTRDLRQDLFESVVYQSQSFFQRHHSGGLLTRLLADVQKLKSVVTHDVPNGVRGAGTIPFMFLVIIWHDWRMSLITVLVLGTMILPFVMLSRRLRKVSLSSQEATGEASHLASEAIHGIEVVQAFGMEEFEVGRFRSALERLLRIDLKAARAIALAPAMLEVVGALAGSALFLFAGWGVSRGQVDPGDFSVVVGALGLLFASFRILTRANNQIQAALASGERVFEILETESEIQDRPGAATVQCLDRSLTFDRVSFAYQDEGEGHPVLHDIDLEIRKGEVVALVGRSGAGKTTLVSLVPRFFDPVSGSVRFDGVDLRDLTVRSVRSLIALVTQETILFDASVADNIAYGHDCDHEDIRKAARAAHADDFIRELPKGYETVLGEGGGRLSAGQRQRLAIARAILKNPEILLLDEPTSALDAESEVKVQAALDRLMERRTCLVIAHRLATVQKADRIVVLEAGRVVEEGTHNELLARGGAYARLHELQFASVGPTEQVDFASP